MLSRALEGKRRQPQTWHKSASPTEKIKQVDTMSKNKSKSNTKSFYSLHYSDEEEEEEEGWSYIGGDLPITFCGGNGSCSDFGLREVLRSTVQVLGMSSLGISEKIVLLDGSTFAAKRFRKVKVGRGEFAKRVERLAHLCRKCQQLVPVRAYLYSKRTKLVLCNYYPMGSLADLLSGAREQNHTPLDWKTRWKIMVDVAKAMAYIHSQPIYSNSKRRFVANVHGNIKTSNMFVTTDFSARLSDYGSMQLASSVSAPRQELSQKGDVYDFGVMVLDILGGTRAPHQIHCILERLDEIKRGECHFFEYFVEGREMEEKCAVLTMALDCVHDDLNRRPSADQIVVRLNDVLN